MEKGVYYSTYRNVLSFMRVILPTLIKECKAMRNNLFNFVVIMVQNCIKKSFGVFRCIV